MKVRIVFFSRFLLALMSCEMLHIIPMFFRTCGDLAFSTCIYFFIWGTTCIYLCYKHSANIRHPYRSYRKGFQIFRLPNRVHPHHKGAKDPHFKLFQAIYNGLGWWHDNGIVSLTVSPLPQPWRYCIISQWLPVFYYCKETILSCEVLLIYLCNLVVYDFIYVFSCYFVFL